MLFLFVGDIPKGHPLHEGLGVLLREPLTLARLLLCGLGGGRSNGGLVALKEVIQHCCRGVMNMYDARGWRDGGEPEGSERMDPCCKWSHCGEKYNDANATSYSF